jgi:hypothetical protein
VVLNDFEDLVTRNAVELLEVVPLWGVQPDAVIPLLDNIQLVPLQTVPRSVARDQFLNIPRYVNEVHQSQSGIIPKPRAALTRRFLYSPVLFPDGKEPPVAAASREDIPDTEQLLDVARSLTAILRRPIFPLAHWYQADESLPLVLRC